jgi:thioredoxin reductase (NADPH)
MTSMQHESDLIVGAGPIGLACAISAVRRGRHPLIIDAGPIASSIVRYPIGMHFFTTPERLEIGNHPVVTAGGKATREEALMYYRGVARAEGLRVRPYTRLLGARRDETTGRIHCEVETRAGNDQVTCDRLVLATGYFDHPNLLGVPGEDLSHVSHYFDEPHVTAGLRVVIIGGKNSAIESALLAFRAGAQVTLVYRRDALKPSVKYWLKPDFDNRVKAGEIEARFGANVVEITPRHVTIETGGGARENLAADRVYALTGYHPDFALFESIGIRLDATGRPELNETTLETNVPGVFMAGSVTGGRQISEVFIENGRYDGEKIFGDSASREQATELYASSFRAVDE